MTIYAYNGKLYPEYLKQGDAGQYIFAIAKSWCQGIGLDIGGTQTCTLPGARPINPNYYNYKTDNKYDAYNLPDEKYDYIFSSHTLEHLDNYIKALEYWKDHLKEDGTLFLYLPHPDMYYWNPINNRKHLHIFTPEYITTIIRQLDFPTVFNSERDLFWSFSVVGKL